MMVADFFSTWLSYWPAFLIGLMLLAGIWASFISGRH